MNPVPSAYGFEIARGGQGAVFALSGNAKRNRCQPFGSWEAELRKDSPYVCVRGVVSNLNEPLSDLVEAADGVAQDFLDIVAVEERASLLVVEPHNNVVWRTGPHGLKVQLTSSITFSAELGDIKVSVTDSMGQIRPDPPYVPPQHHFAYRYFRYSQAAQNLFDSYRNMFLALESLLDYVEPKQSGEGETEWLKRALTTVVRLRGLSLAAFTKAQSNDQVDDFLDAHYSAVRCGVFHAKSSSGGALRPGSLGDQDVVLHQLLAVQDLVEPLLKSEFSVRLPQSGLFHSGFGHLLSVLAPVTTLFVSVSDCPTLEQVMANKEELPEGTALPVTFAGLNGALTDEWLFVSESKPEEWSFSKVGSFRLVAQPNTHLFLSGIADKMNRTLMSTDLELEGVSKLVIRIRCVLRNLQLPKRGFSH